MRRSRSTRGWYTKGRRSRSEPLHTPIDFAIASGRVIRLTQTSSFQLSEGDRLSEHVKAWAYALTELRRGQDARIEDNGQLSMITKNVDPEIVIAEPKTAPQQRAFDKAT